MFWANRHKKLSVIFSALLPLLYKNVDADALSCLQAPSLKSRGIDIQREIIP
jgi:hypothetical protein